MTVEVLTVRQLQRSRSAGGDTYVDWFTVGAVQVEDEDGDLLPDRVEERTRLRVIRTPTTEARILPQTRVLWRADEWTVRQRAENQRRTHYELTLERSG